MKVIETNGITYLEKFDGCAEWYWGTDYSSGDLYEAEQLFLSEREITPNRLIFVRYPDGKIFEPIHASKKQYFGRPAFVDGTIYILLISFEEKIIYIYECSNDMKETKLIKEISLDSVEDCYNLKLDGEPLMLTRQGGNNFFQIVWPEKTEFKIEVRESFLFKKDNRLYFSVWYEDPEYREEINVREYSTGKLLEKIEGTEMTMPNGESWILR